jgi:hypothetical protein
MTTNPKVIRKKGLEKISISCVETDECSKAYTILKYTHDSSFALHQAYRLARDIRAFKSRKKGEQQESKEFKEVRGLSTDEEQDLLRAMLVMAASGLDAVTKQIIRDTLPTLVRKDSNAQEELEKFVRGRIKGDTEGPDGTAGGKYLARILVADSIQQRLIEDYISNLTGSSLQSAEELSKTAKALAIQPQDAGINAKELKPIFDCRNKIIHELDINLEGKYRKRNVRSESKMLQYTNALISVAEELVKAVDKRLKTSD